MNEKIIRGLIVAVVIATIITSGELNQQDKWTARYIGLGVLVLFDGTNLSSSIIMNTT